MPRLGRPLIPPSERRVARGTIALNEADHAFVLELGRTVDEYGFQQGYPSVSVGVRRCIHLARRYLEEHKGDALAE